MVHVSEMQSQIAPVAADRGALARWKSPGAALISAMIPGLGQVVLGQAGMAATFIGAALVLILLAFPPFRLEATYPGWLFLIFGGWLLTLAACCHALRSRGENKTPGNILWLFLMLPLTVGFPVVSQAFALPIEGFREYRMAGTSMEPALRPGDVVMADMRYFRAHAIIRGEIVLLKSPNTPGVVIVKRVIAIGGDTVSGKDGRVILDGRALNEAYVEHMGQPIRDMENFGPVTIPPHKLFVMGDNRDFSFDSRAPEFGLVNDSSVVGRPLYIISQSRRRVGNPLS